MNDSIVEGNDRIEVMNTIGFMNLYGTLDDRLKSMDKHVEALKEQHWNAGFDNAFRNGRKFDENTLVMGSYQTYVGDNFIPFCSKSPQDIVIKGTSIFVGYVNMLGNYFIETFKVDENRKIGSWGIITGDRISKENELLPGLFSGVSKDDYIKKMGFYKRQPGYTATNGCKN